MRKKLLLRAMTQTLIGALLCSTLAFSQDVSRLRTAKDAATANESPIDRGYLFDVTQTAGYDTNTSYSREAQLIARILSSNSKKNPVLIDNQGYARDAVLGAVASRLASDSQGKRLYRINWNAIRSEER